MWGEHDEQILPGVRLLRADRKPCPVCGHPTGDCAGEVPPRRIVGEEFVDPRKVQPQFLVQEDVYEQVELSAFTTTTVLVAKAGTYISHAKAVELGLTDP